MQKNQFGETRKDLHSSISPAVYSRHAREDLIPDIENLPFLNKDLGITNLVAIANRIGTEHLEYYVDNVDKKAIQYGIYDRYRGIGILDYGFIDRHFTPLFAGAAGIFINNLLIKEGILTEGLSLKDYAKMFQTGWFGDLANKMALTSNGLLQPDTNSQTGFNFSFLENSYKKEIIPFVTEQEPESGLLIIKPSRDLLTDLRFLLNKNSSIGCPVARTSFTSNETQAAFLENQGHIGETSGFVIAEESLVRDGIVKFTQGAYTAIDAVLWTWGDYLDRYADYLIENGITEKVQETEANKVLLLD